MKNLPVPVSDEEIEEMFAVVDKNGDERLSYREFQRKVEEFARKERDLNEKFDKT